ncbi:MAG: ABC transporter ATP-binding protein [Dethiobacteria bacterium]|nr:ABC transporter ATP-binding protein [Dethiobacteria bacterium]
MSDATTNISLLEVRDLSVIYKTDEATVYAVNGINFSVSEKETIGIVGETGAGKTTTALSIMRLLQERTGRITGGKILFKGENLLLKSRQKMQHIRGALISMIFQDPMTSLNPIKTVGDQILESLKLHNYDNKSKVALGARVDELLNLVGIQAQRKNEYPHQFSGGMKQRVVIAIALACEPQLLIADEPTTALDVTIQAQVLSLIDELKEKLNTAMIIITHDLGIVAQTCDKVAIMYAGRIVEQGTVEQIFLTDVHHPYTVGLFGSIPKLDDDSNRLQPIQGLMPDPTTIAKGCPFQPRCLHSLPVCSEVEPPVYEKDGHYIVCYLYAKED